METATRSVGYASQPSSIRLLSADEVLVLMAAAAYDNTPTEFDRIVRSHLGFPHSVEFPFKNDRYELVLDNFRGRIVNHRPEDLIVAQVNWNGTDWDLIYITSHTENFSDDTPVIPWTMGGICCCAQTLTYYCWSSFEEPVDDGVKFPMLVGAMLGKDLMTESALHFKNGADIAKIMLVQAESAYAEAMAELIDFNRSMKTSMALFVGRRADPRAFELENRSAKVAENATKVREAAHSASAWVVALATVGELDRVAAYSAVQVPAAAIPASVDPITGVTSMVPPPQKSEVTIALEAAVPASRKSELLSALEALQRLVGAMPDAPPADAGGSLTPVIPTVDAPAVDVAAETEPVVAVPAEPVPTDIHGSASEDIHLQLKLAIDGINAVAVSKRQSDARA
jgi:hypothetical protein